MAREQDIFHLPYQILEEGPDLLLALNRNFKEVERMLSQLQLYEKQIGKPINELVQDNYSVWDSADENTRNYLVEYGERKIFKQDEEPIPVTEAYEWDLWLKYEEGSPVWRQLRRTSEGIYEWVVVAHRGEIPAEYNVITALGLDAGVVTTGVLEAARVAIGSSSSFSEGYDPSEKETPEGAQAKVDALGEGLGDMAYEDLVEFAKLGNTVIEGGYLKTELIKVSDIFATNTTIEATLTMGANGLIVVNNNTVINNQGILQTWQDSHTDNVDSTHKLILKIYIPPETQQIRKITLSFTRENFRAYSKGVPSGGGHTTPSGGGHTTPSGGGSTSGSSSKSTADSGGNHRHVMFVADTTGSYATNRYLGCYTDAAGNNTASISAGVSGAVGQWTSLYTSGSSGTHSHGMNHTHSTPSHSHSVNDHTHSVSNHTHDIDYGIYTSTSATYNEVFINGTKRLPASGTYTSNQQNLDLSPWITTTGWHTIEISSGRLGRINAVAFIQVFLGL